MKKTSTTALSAEAIFNPHPEPLIGNQTMLLPSTLKHPFLEKSFLKAIVEHQGLLHKICRAYCEQRADQEDLYQEIIYQLWKSYPRFNGNSKVSTWMYTVALRAAILPFRRRTVRIEFHEVLPDRASDEQRSHTIDDKLFRLFHRLQSLDRAVLVLMMEGFAVKEIAAVLGLTQKAVTMRATRIRNVIQCTK